MAVVAVRGILYGAAMATVDWIVIGGFLASMMALGLYFSRRAGGSMADFFVSGRNLPWWLAGTSILATSFASDTPLHVTKVIREQGLGGAWFYWAGILTAPMVAFLFARLWRRSRVVTDVELIELRYAGRPAAILRCFMAIFRTFVMAALTMGWVILGMAKVLRVVLELPPYTQLPLRLPAVPTDALVVTVLVLIALIYTMASGMWGVVMTDFIEFGIATVGAIILAVIALDRVGGVAGLKEGLDQVSQLRGEALDFVPRPGSLGISWGSFLVFVCVLGWAHAEADGSGNKAQRFLACKDERNSLATGLWAVLVQNVIRSWPWYLAALCSIILYPQLADNETAYPRMMAELLPAGIKGFMVAAFLAAFMSTIDTHLNLGASYLVNDLYRRFVRQDRSERHYVMAARLAIIVMAFLSALIALNLGSVLGALKLKGEMMAGLGLVVMLRWYWWRINAWSEVSAMVASVVTCAALHRWGWGVGTVSGWLGIDLQMGGDPFPARLLIILAVATMVWVTVTFATPPVSKEHLAGFYARVRPPGRLWGPIANLVEGGKVKEKFSRSVVDWVVTSVFVLTAMFGLGKFLLGFPGSGALFVGVAVVTGVVAYRRVFGSATPRRG